MRQVRKPRHGHKDRAKVAVHGNGLATASVPYADPANSTNRSDRFIAIRYEHRQRPLSAHFQTLSTTRLEVRGAE